MFTKISPTFKEEYKEFAKKDPAGCLLWNIFYYSSIITILYFFGVKGLFVAFCLMVVL